MVIETDVAGKGQTILVSGLTGHVHLDHCSLSITHIPCTKLGFWLKAHHDFILTTLIRSVFNVRLVQYPVFTHKLHAVAMQWPCSISEYIIIQYCSDIMLAMIRHGF